MAVADGHRLFCRDQIDVAGKNLHPVIYTVNGHGRLAGENFVHEAFEIRREVLDNNKGHPAIYGCVVEEMLKRFQPPGRSTYARYI